ncbi:DUF3857 domain-containing protein [Flavobacterium sp. F372]|uniref:DUF3857 domain-containing protein n=1 Tax=Flavobacterium bernardetii TaxID=2813823 RepID=A0ABR7J1J0_9FLAO|nr:DUF3857 domain-containing protein [Flavobacterium bernardetii]MBC5835929.1 DUF3857 domain-containing protein [Flavobacterium bernardetii]NHF71125.1 DUF3857 domain-containing protein [Flavobacterium bernardetii]
MKKLILTLLFPVLVLAQDYDLGKVTIAELNQKQHPTDTSAVAAILFNKGKSCIEYTQSDGFVLITEVVAKIKIYKKSGFDWANKQVSYYVGSQEDESLIFSKAATYNLVNGKIEKTKLNSDGEFDEKYNKYWKFKKITLPNVKEGSIIEYKYTIKSVYLSNIPDWQFQQVIPVDYSEFVTKIPEYWTFKYYTRGFIQPVFKTDVKAINIELKDKFRTIPGVSGASSTNYSTQNMEYSETTNKFTLKNLPALVEESYSNNIVNYLSGVQHELASTQFKNQATKMFSQSWEDVVEKIYKNSDFGLELNKESYFEEDLNKLIKGQILSENEKIIKIFDFVKNKVKWNNLSGIYTDVGVKKAYLEGVGNVADINLILTKMLRNSGIKANPVLLTTRSRAINLYPSSDAFNYVICGVEIGDKIVFLDATDKLLKPDVLPTRALNYIGRLVRENGTSTEVDLSPKVHSKKSVMIFASVDNQSIKGNIKETLTENRAYNFREKNNAISEESYLENIEKNMSGFEISEYKIENKKDEKESLKEDYNFTSTNEIEVINDKLFFKPLLFFAIDENPFKQDKRDYPIDFKYPTHDSYTLTYNLPQGYVVESMPEKMNIATEDNLSSFSFLIGQTGNKIQIVSNFYINSAMVPSDYYDTLKVFYNQVYLKMNEKIVLKKQ